MAPHSLIIRTFDLGGDKIASHLDSDDEQNPFLGLRAIRFSLENLDIFKTQLCAILRASAAGNVKIMFPMISGVMELRRALRGVGRVQRRAARRRASRSGKKRMWGR